LVWVQLDQFSSRFGAFSESVRFSGFEFRIGIHVFRVGKHVFRIGISYFPNWEILSFPGCLFRVGNYVFRIGNWADLVVMIFSESEFEFVVFRVGNSSCCFPSRKLVFSESENVNFRVGICNSENVNFRVGICRSEKCLFRVGKWTLVQVGF